MPQTIIVHIYKQIIAKNNRKKIGVRLLFFYMKITSNNQLTNQQKISFFYHFSSTT